MAEIAADLPKWQAEQMLYQTTKYYSTIFLFDIQGMACRIPIRIVPKGEKND
jgi:hypothetical protein